jgi:hypothetical protein
MGWLISLPILTYGPQTESLFVIVPQTCKYKSVKPVSLSWYMNGIARAWSQSMYYDLKIVGIEVSGFYLIFKAYFH